MSKYVIKRKIPKYQEAGEVTPIMPGNVVGLQGIGVEPLVSSTRIGFDIQQPDINTIDTSDLNAIVDSNKKVDKSGSTDVFDFTTIPYYGADDIGSRFTQMGRGIGRMRSEGYGNLSTGAKTANVVGTVMSGIGGVLGLARNVFSGMASEQGTRTNIRLAQEREARQRRQSQMQYKDGGGVYLGPNNRFDSGSLTGEYLYPLPKSMEDQANVEVEKGEYVEQPGEAPMEAMGQKHADGGTPVSLEEGTKVITDDTTIESDFAKYIRDTYGIKATPRIRTPR